jgi:hypothetical protein
MAQSGKAQRLKKEKNDVEKPVIARTAYDLQRLKLEKLMKNGVCNSAVLFVLSNLNSTLLRTPCGCRVLYQRHRSQ